MKLVYLVLIFCNLIFSIEKCGFHLSNLELSRERSNCTNIEMQNIYLSPQGNFYIHFDNSPRFNDLGEIIYDHSPDLTDINPYDGIPDYINEVAEVADSSYRLLNDIMNFKEGANGDDNITDIFVLDLNGSAYGWARPINSCIDSCVEIDNNYEETEYYTNGIDAMKVTLIHEYFHTIQFAYRCSAGINSYFYELTSTWIEDIGYPDVNDYLNFMISSNSYKNYFKYPEQDFDDTNGYSVALFGHYLSTQFEENDGIMYQDELSSMVMNKIWDRIDNTSQTALAAVDYVLQNDYNTSFNEAWIDFNTRNLFNQIDEDMYYYEDQSLIEKINIDEYFILDNNSYNSSFSLSYKSVTIPSFSLYNKGKINIGITTNDELLFGNMVILSNSDYSLVPLFSDYSQLIDSEDVIYFIFGTNENSLSVNLNLEPIYVPQEPKNIMSLIGTNFVDLWWNHSTDFQDDYLYNIYRNGNYIDSTIDSFYYDTNINTDTQYIYEVTAQNDIGNSDPISINIDTSYPDYPLKPDHIFSVIDNEKNHIWWTKADGIGDISYLILRNNDSINTTIDTFYYDFNMDPNTLYNYSIHSVNKVGRSIESISINSTSWPDIESINHNDIINLYPNPLDLSLNNNINLILDIDKSTTSDIILYDINGRQIKSWKNIQFDKGRQRIELENTFSLPISSGMYFIYSNNQSRPLLIHN